MGTAVKKTLLHSPIKALVVNGGHTVKVDAYWKGSTAVVKLVGEFDLSAADDFNKTVRAFRQDSRLRQVIVDLQGVSFIDSSGLGALLGRFRELQQEDIELVIAAPSHWAGEILGLAGIDRFINIYPSVEDVPEPEDGEG